MFLFQLTNKIIASSSADLVSIVTIIAFIILNIIFFILYAINRSKKKYITSEDDQIVLEHIFNPQQLENLTKYPKVNTNDFNREIRGAIVKDDKSSEMKEEITIEIKHCTVCGKLLSTKDKEISSRL